MSQLEATLRYSYNIDALDRSVRKTNNLLRFANALRLTGSDIQQVMKAPTIANVMWTLIQLTRTWTSLQRLLRSIEGETRALATGAGFLQRITGLGPAQAPRLIGQSFVGAFGRFAVTTEASINGIPVPISALDISNIGNLSAGRIQEVLERQAPLIVGDAQRILTTRIIHPEKSTGRLASSIGWESRLPGVNIFASAPYSFWVEEGQRSFTGHHFLKDAGFFARFRITEAIKRELNDLILG